MCDRYSIFNDDNKLVGYLYVRSSGFYPQVFAFVERNQPYTQFTDKRGNIITEQILAQQTAYYKEETIREDSKEPDYISWAPYDSLRLILVWLSETGWGSFDNINVTRLDGFRKTKNPTQ